MFLFMVLALFEAVMTIGTSIELNLLQSIKTCFLDLANPDPILYIVS